MTRQGDSSTRHDATGARALLRSFATMWRNAAIYAPDHPRVTAAIAATLDHLAATHQGDGDRLLQVADGALEVGGERFPIDDRDAEPLVARLREVGLRGLELTCTCEAADLAEFLTAAKRNRRRAADPLVARWPADHPRLRTLPLVFDGSFDGGTLRPPHGPSEPTRRPRPGSGPSTVAPQVQLALQRLAQDPELQQRVQAVERLTTTEPGDDTITLRLLERVGTLLPADVSGNAEVIADTVKQILTRVERDLGELVRRGARVRGSGLMRQALTVARTVFGTNATPPTQGTKLPTGRPEDEAIAADVDLLLAEIEALPPADGLQLSATNDRAVREQFGACLHMVAHGQRGHVGAGLQRWLGTFLEQHGERLRDVWLPYTRCERSGPRTEAERRAVLQALLAAGAPGLAAARPHLDAPFLAATFPESLPWCVRALGSDDAGRTILRDGLMMVAPMLQLGGVEAAERSGVLADLQVVEVLLALDLPAVRDLLPAMARQATGPTLEPVLRHAQRLPLQPAEAAVLRCCQSAADLPATFLARLLTTWAKQRTTPQLQQECHALLRANVQRQLGTGDQQALLDAIDALQHAPDAETLLLLRHLARRHRWSPWDRAARAVRVRAAATLHRLVRNA